MHPSKRKGTDFERRVVARLKENGWYAIRQGSSRFPDIISIKKGHPAMIIECKLNKYISKEEKKKLKLMECKFGHSYIAYRRVCESNKRKTEIVLCSVDYEEIGVL